MSTTVWEVVAAIFVIAIVYMLARPGSPAAQAVSDLSDALKNIILTATGGTSGPGSFTNPVLPA